MTKGEWLERVMRCGSILACWGGENEIGTFDGLYQKVSFVICRLLCTSRCIITVIMTVFVVTFRFV